MIYMKQKLNWTVQHDSKVIKKAICESIKQVGESK